MKLILLLLLITLSLRALPSEHTSSFIKNADNTKIPIKHYNSTSKRIVYRIYTQTKNVPGIVNKNEIKRLNEPLIALAAFYSAMNGTMCNGVNCDLTSNLGLGKQGSDKHKFLIKKYFPQDKVATAILKQDCYQRPSGASSFSEYKYITLTTYGDTVRVDYKVLYYDRGIETWNQGPDFYTFKNNKFKVLKRNLWKHVKE
ncbi:hypothetical protein [Pedobacter sp. B4-66]|uniref:hypothetical protein n=1 Tax=Pedobacter sp. B4-66 TaxID=2817280 RepID=UPI001BDA0508|nr:hypothetical protein [Pedobacter sp. B4-66]